MTAPLLTIGRAADQAGVTTRTLRYYEQLDLLTPAGRSVGGARRYSPADVERVARIRQLQDLLGHDLEQIRRVLLAEDRLAEMRAEWRAGASPARQQELLAEATDINNSLRAQVKARSAALQSFADELEETARRYRRIARELRAEPRAPTPT
jgi:DNA-binding transcriptional MerR regulator